MLSLVFQQHPLLLLALLPRPRPLVAVMVRHLLVAGPLSGLLSTWPRLMSIGGQHLLKLREVLTPAAGSTTDHQAGQDHLQRATVTYLGHEGGQRAKYDPKWPTSPPNLEYPAPYYYSEGPTALSG
ncbi:hypothetical protein GWK47_018176 [Chionoecetes opilio]|uniref:Uncharacterized protein n=1 Tax=Chionoecetes opilio TaxID=41210 RepID=A0A8J4XTB4_CHIOP|nr:hypothetical protein GWK47_018176 [Chionoecetes opilio]